MTGFVLAHGDCINCGRPFSFNPVWVPSVRVKGVRQPVCRACMEGENSRRKAAGQPLLAIHPDAYEACEEGELG